MYEGEFSMFKSAVVGALMLAVTGSAYSQSSAPAPTSESPAQSLPNAAGIPPCPTFAEQRAALGQKSPAGSEKLAAQPAERSGILSSGTTNRADPSAAPTMADNGQNFRSPLDCPLIPEHPNAVKPGTTVLPKFSKWALGRTVEVSMFIRQGRNAAGLDAPKWMVVDRVGFEPT
jgi:hypothetical protein